MNPIVNISYYKGNNDHDVIFVACDSILHYEKIIEWCKQNFDNSKFYYKWVGLHYDFLHYSDDINDIEGLYIILYELYHLEIFMLKWGP